MAKPRKVNTSKAAEATLVEGAYRLLSVCTDARLADLCDRLLTASKALRAERRLSLALASHPAHNPRGYSGNGVPVSVQCFT